MAQGIHTDATTDDEPSQSVRQFSLTLRSERQEIAKVELFMRAVPYCQVLDDMTFYSVMVAITEAVNNAIVHGNKLDESKEVILRVSSNASTMIVTVQDGGTGFDPTILADPREPENLMKTGGRGIFLIRELASEVHYSKNSLGSELTLVFRK